MKVLLVQSTIYIPTHGGENKANRLLLEGLAAKGHACRVVAPACGAQGPGARAQFLAELAARGLAVERSEGGSDVFSQNGVEVHAVTEGTQLRRRVAEQIAEFDPTWVLVSSEDPGQVLLEAALGAAPGRVVYVAHTMLFFPFGPHSFLANPARAELLGQAAGIITVSQYLKDYIRRWGGCESAVIPFPVYGAGPFPRFGRFDEGAVTLINPCAYKGISVFLGLARRMPEVEFAAVPSWGTTGSDLEDLGRLPNVRVLKARDGIDEIFAQTRVLLMPSLWGEGFPLVPVEAMLRGIPVIASDSGGLPESKLGVDYVLPIRPIERYEQRFDDRMLPVAVVPEQDLGRWERTLRDLLASREVYERVAGESRRAALAYVSGLGVGPFEEYLSSLAPGTRARIGAADIAAPGREAATDDRREKAEQLTPERRALLALRLRQRNGGGRQETRVIPRRAGDEDLPLSFAQERVWFLDQWEPGNPAYNNVDAFRLDGELDLAALKQSLNEIVRRHEALRTAFASVNGRPVQVIAPELDLEVALEDLSEAPEPEQEVRAAAWLIEQARRPFDLARGPLLRAALLRLGPRRHLLVLTWHHIVSDGWSGGVLFHELGALYGAAREERLSPLAELPIQYADFALWQRGRLTGELLERDLAYWRARMAGAPEVLALPTDRPRPAAQTFRGARRATVLPAGLVRRLRELAQGEGATLFMTLLAGFQALLSRYSGQEDLVVG
ncbi:MAG TPA: condensation domain-containing protein, partial [Blastocatellia bacterium]|nr:condensation domain-containing protein [Blastocatellia bacterium]